MHLCLIRGGTWPTCKRAGGCSQRGPFTVPNDDCLAVCVQFFDIQPSDWGVQGGCPSASCCGNAHDASYCCTSVGRGHWHSGVDTCSSCCRHHECCADQSVGCNASRLRLYIIELPSGRLCSTQSFVFSPVHTSTMNPLLHCWHQCFHSPANGAERNSVSVR